MGVSHGDVSWGMSIGQVTGEETRIKDEAKPGEAERNGCVPSEGANHS